MYSKLSKYNRDKKLTLRSKMTFNDCWNRNPSVGARRSTGRGHVWSHLEVSSTKWCPQPWMHGSLRTQAMHLSCGEPWWFPCRPQGSGTSIKNQSVLKVYRIQGGSQLRMGFHSWLLYMSLGRMWVVISLPHSAPILPLFSAENSTRVSRSVCADHVWVWRRLYCYCRLL